MEGLSSATTGEDFVDIASVRILDLRSLGQDEIRCLARLCGDVPARLQDLVNVIIDKSIFNESVGSRRQTFDRDRVPRNKDRRLSAGSASAQLHLALEGAGLSHRDLILHICRQLHIAEKGDKALYQAHVPQPVGIGVEGNRSMSLKRMARASFTGRSYNNMASASSEGAVNGKGMAMEVLHRSSKKMKTKEEARRKAAESQAVAIASDAVELRDELVAAKIISSGHEERVVLKNIPKRASAEAQSDLKSFQSQIARSISVAMDDTELLNLAQEKSQKRIKLHCSTCSGTFANMYSLRRHTSSTGHILDESLFINEVAQKRKQNAVANSSLRCSCGNTYATPYTLRRHAIRNGHTMIMVTIPNEGTKETQDTQQFDQVGTSSKGSKLGKGNLQTYLAKRTWKNSTRQFKCRHCLRQFMRKKHYVRHLNTHFKKSTKKKKKLGRPVSKLLAGQLGSLSDGVKTKRIGRPPKLDKAVVIEQERVKQKRKHEPERLDRHTKSRKEEETSQRTPVSIPSGKPATLTCQECGRIFEEFSRYSGHLSMHARLRKIYVGEIGTPTRKLNLLHLKDFSDLGYRKLLKEDTTGTYLSGLPAKLLFSESQPNEQIAEV